MDLVYMSDSMSFHSIRSSIYNRYENQFQPIAQQVKAEKLQNEKRGSDKCKICKEKQRRILGNYKHNSCSYSTCIPEEEEEKTSCPSTPQEATT